MSQPFFRLHKRLFLFVLSAAFLAQNARAQNPADLPGVIALNSQPAPATDLMYQGRVLNPDEVSDLRSRGLDLSTLDPDASTDLWQNLSAPLPNSALVSADANLYINASNIFMDPQPISSRNGNFRFVAYMRDGSMSRPYTFLVSKTAHNVLLRKALLRKLGFIIAPNKRIERLHLRFSTPGAKELFLDNLAQSTFGDTKRWVVENDPNASDLVLQDLVAFDADTTMYNLAMGFIPKGVIKGRRLLNSLLIPYELVDNPESVNIFAWSFGRVVSNYLKLNYDSAGEFDGNVDDARWIARRILALSVNDWQDVVNAADLPPSVGLLLLQKIISRRNDMAKQLSFKSSAPLPYNPNISSGTELVNGKLSVETWPGYGSRFAYGDPDSPLSNSELWALAKSRFLSNILANALFQLNDKLMPHTDLDQALQDHQIDVTKEALLHFFKTGDIQKVPFAFYAIPLFGGSLSASRDVVVGSYMGTDNQVQLADSIGLSVYAGAYIGVQGLAVPWSANIQGKGTLTRTYSHLRPIKSIKAALKYPFKNALVPVFMREQANLFDDIAQLANDSSASEDDKKDKLKKAIAAFKDNIGVGESILITDSIGAGVDIRAGYSYDQWIGVYGTFSANQIVLSRMHILRFDENTIHIYRDLGDKTKLMLSITLKAFLPVAEVSAQHSVGHAHTKFYSLSLDESNPENVNLTRNVLALREVLNTQSLEAVESIRKPFKLNYLFNEDVGRAGILMWKWASLKSNLKLEVIHPDSGERRGFYRKIVSKMHGVDYESLATDALNAALNDAIDGEGMVTSPGNGRPSDSIMGSSVLRTTNVDGIIDGPLDANRDFIREPYVSVIYAWQGWAIKNDNAQKILDKINHKNATQFYPPDALHGVNRILFYDINLSYQIYTPGIEHLLAASDDEVTAIFKNNTSEDGGNADSNARRFLKLRRSFDRKYRKGKIEKYSKYMAELVSVCESSLTKSGLFAIFGGEENLLITSRIQGFREGDENGDKPYFSNTAGEIGSRAISGPLEDMRIQLKIAPSEFFLYWMLERL